MTFDSQPPVPASDTEPQRHRFEQTGTGKATFAIAVKNALLGIVTLGLYRFWGVTRVRRYLWGTTRFLNDPLEYHGTGKELLVGAIVAFVLVIIPLIGLQMAVELAFADESGQPGWLGILPGLVILFLLPIAIYRARRYRLGRTAWRGIRGSQTGSAIGYALVWLAWTISLSASLGLTWPLRAAALARYTINRSMFGERSFSFEGKASALYRPFLAAWGTAVIAIGGFAALTTTVQSPAPGEPPPATIVIGLVVLMLTLLMIFFWYRAAELRYVARHTRFGDLTFSADVRGGQLAWLSFTNMLIVPFTLGLGLPYTMLRNARLAAAALSVHGDAAALALEQNAQAKSKTGEGLASVLDIDAF